MKQIFSLIFPCILITGIISCSTSTKEDASEKNKSKLGMNITEAAMVLGEVEPIPLNAPDLDKPSTLMMALKNRRSDRSFKSENLSLRQLSDILWAADGLNRDDSVHTTAASAKALYPIQIYAVLRNGIYKYDKVDNRLEPVVKGDYMEMTGMQPFVKDAPLNLLYVADLKKQDDLIWAAADAGHISQNVYLYCAAEGLKTVIRGSVESDPLVKMLGLDPQQYKVILAQSVGK